MFRIDKERTFEADLYDLNEILRQYPMFDDEIIELCGVTKQTLRRWKEKNVAPVAMKRLIWIHASGYLPCNNGWAGMRISGDTLITDIGQKLTSGDIRAVFFSKSLQNAQREEILNLRQQVVRYKKVITSLESKLLQSGKLWPANMPFHDIK